MAYLNKATNTIRGNLLLSNHLGGTDGDAPQVVNHGQITGTADLHTEYLNRLVGTAAMGRALPMGGFAITGLGAPSGANDAVRFNANDSPTFNNLTIAGNLTVQGTRTVVQGEQTAFADNYLEINDGYTADAAQSCGIVANYDPTTTTSAVAGAGFVAGVAATSNPTVEVAATTGFAAGDIVLVTGAGINNGFYEVNGLLATPARLQIKGVGTVAATEAWTKDQFTTAAAAGNVYKTAVSVIRCGTDGVWETASGASVPLTYTDLQNVITYGTVGQYTTVDAGSVAAAGTSTNVARADHEHAVTTAAPSQQTIAASAGEGVAAGLARADHTHTFASAAPAASGSLAAASAVGTSTSFARADHAHSTDPGARSVALGTSTNGWKLFASDLYFDSASISNKTAAYTVTDGDCLVLGDTSTAGFSLTLPASPTVGRRLWFKKTVAPNTLTIDAGDPGRLIDGAQTKALTANGESLKLVCTVGGASARWVIF